MHERKKNDFLDFCSNGWAMLKGPSNFFFFFMVNLVILFYFIVVNGRVKLIEFKLINGLALDQLIFLFFTLKPNPP